MVFAVSQQLDRQAELEDKATIQAKLFFQSSMSNHIQGDP